VRAKSVVLLLLYSVMDIIAVWLIDTILFFYAGM
jgi:hypothetical protein